jgi:hypothetical protein
MTRRLAVATAVIATIGAFFSYLGGLTEANAGLYKNEAAIRKTEATNQWNYYQAKSHKQNLAELAIEFAPESRRAYFVGEVDRYKSEKEAIKKDAEKFERESDEWSKRSDEEIHQHHRWAPGHDGTPDCDRAGRDRAADEEPATAVRRLRTRRSRARCRLLGLAPHLIARPADRTGRFSSFAAGGDTSPHVACRRVAPDVLRHRLADPTAPGKQMPETSTGTALADRSIMDGGPSAMTSPIRATREGRSHQRASGQIADVEPSVHEHHRHQGRVQLLESTEHQRWEEGRASQPGRSRHQMSG